MQFSQSIPHLWLFFLSIRSRFNSHSIVCVCVCVLLFQFIALTINAIWNVCRFYSPCLFPSLALSISLLVYFVSIVALLMLETHPVNSDFYPFYNYLINVTNNWHCGFHHISHLRCHRPLTVPNISGDKSRLSQHSFWHIKKLFATSHDDAMVSIVVQLALP